MSLLFIIVLVGCIAQLMDGSLGRGCGVITTSLLLAYNVTPAIASVSVNIAKIFTTAAAGVSHMKLKNIDKATLYQLILLGSIGSFIGVCLFSKLSGELTRPYISLFL